MISAWLRLAIFEAMSGAEPDQRLWIIVENCGNTLILRCSASKQGGTAKVASRLIGGREIFRVHESRSRRGGSWESSRTLSEQHVTEAAVPPSDIEQLPDLSGCLKLASSPSWRRVQIPLPRR